jgi:hypothetical protein
MPLSPLVTPAQVVVDDRDPTINYVYNDKPIFLGGRQNLEFDNTTSGLGTKSSASFLFRGTSFKRPGR